MKKKGYSMFTMLLFIGILQAQISDPSFDPTAESARMVSIPNSPEAQAFTKYGNTSVSLYTGTPNIQIPIYVHKGRELDLPISLTYDASGVKVEQLATQVGLSWNLNVGGRISRITNGFPDDFIAGANTYDPYKSFWDTEVSSKMDTFKDISPGHLFTSKKQAAGYLDFLRKINENEYDTQLDYFSFNALGQSDMFVIDVASKQAKALNNPRIKVSFVKPFPGADSPIQKWIVTTDDGVKYTFDATETTKDVNLNDLGIVNFFGFKKEYYSSWLLTKIESPNGKDVYEFFYTNSGLGGNRNASLVSGVTNVLNCNNTSNINTNGTGSSPYATTDMGFSNSEYTVTQKVLSEIKHNGKRIVNISLLSKRWDFGVGVEKIHIYDDDTNNDVADLYKSYTFNYDYFRTSFAKVPPYNNSYIPNPLFIRLKLDGVQVKDASNNVLKNYSFEYIEPYILPSITSKGQDYFGYANGKESNTVLYPKAESQYLNNPCIPNDGADRDPVFSYAKRGLLSKITYPTGGHTNFTYEPNYERSINNVSASWQSVSTIQLNTPTLPSLNTSVCNASFLDGFNIQTPATTTSSVFEVTQNSSNYRVVYNQTGTLKKLYDIKNMATLVKLSGPNNTLTWADIYDNNCGVKPGIDVIWSLDVVEPPFGLTPIYPNDFPVTLDTGHYQLILANPSVTLSNSLEIQKSTQTINYTFSQKAGIRIASIKDYTDNTTASLAMHKSYQYPSGTVISNPRYSYTSQQYFSHALTGVTSSTILHRVSYASGTDKPHIGYGEVIEKTEDLTNIDSNGEVSHKFNTGGGGLYTAGVYTYYTDGKETSKNYGVNYELGKNIRSTVYNSQGFKVSSTSNSYYEKEYYSNTGIYVQSKETKSDLYPIPTQHFLGGYYILYTPGVKFSQISGKVGVMPPPGCISINFPTYNVSDLCTPGIGRLAKQTTRAFGKAGNITHSTSKQYSNNGANSIVKVTNYIYDDIPIITQPLPNKPPVTSYPDYLLKETSTTNSFGETVKRELEYPTTGSYLAGKNMVTTILQSKVFKNGNLLSTKKTIYPSSSSLPSKIQIAKGNQALEDRLLFERYENNNLVQVKQVDGTSTTYIWGYELSLPIAKIDNATYAEIQSYVANLHTLSNADKDRTMNGLGSEGALRTSLNALRSSFPDKQITTYTYDPLIGVTSITDPRGRAIYYQYDTFGRLLYVKDQEGNVLKENQYHYKN